MDEIWASMPNTRVGWQGSRSEGPAAPARAFKNRLNGSGANTVAAKARQGAVGGR
jgi:hypothetical protein